MQDHIPPPSASILDFREKASLPVKNRKISLQNVSLSTKDCFLFKIISAVAHFCWAFHVISHWLNWCIISNA